MPESDAILNCTLNFFFKKNFCKKKYCLKCMLFWKLNFKYDTFPKLIYDENTEYNRWIIYIKEFIIASNKQNKIRVIQSIAYKNTGNAVAFALIFWKNV